MATTQPDEDEVQVALTPWEFAFLFCASEWGWSDVFGD